MSKEEDEGRVTSAIEMFSRVKLMPCHGRMPESGDSRACFLGWCESRFLILVHVFMLTSILRLLGILLLLFLPGFLVLLLLDQGIFLKIHLPIISDL